LTPVVSGSQPTLLDLARHSDVLSIHAAATEENRGLVSRTVLAELPSGSIVVNTARGELLDTDALIDLLEQGHLRGAALDVMEGEYAPGFAAGFVVSRVAQYARTHDNLLLTPHIGGSTVDAWRERSATSSIRRSGRCPPRDCAGVGAGAGTAARAAFPLKNLAMLAGRPLIDYTRCGKGMPVDRSHRVLDRQRADRGARACVGC
jgi:hypothetical protein